MKRATTDDGHTTRHATRDIEYWTLVAGTDVWYWCLITYTILETVTSRNRNSTITWVGKMDGGWWTSRPTSNVQLVAARFATTRRSLQREPVPDERMTDVDAAEFFIIKASRAARHTNTTTSHQCSCFFAIFRQCYLRKMIFPSSAYTDVEDAANSLPGS